MQLEMIQYAINLEEVVQNALLKTLEEPPAYDIFFLVTSNANKLLETIRSRCITIKDNEDIDYRSVLELEYLEDAILNIQAQKHALFSKT